MNWTQADVDRINARNKRLGQSVKTAPETDNQPWNERYKSKAEAAFAQSGWRELINALELPEVIWMGFGSYRLYLPGGSYTPDFLLVFRTGTARMFIEVKRIFAKPSGETYSPQQSYRDSRAKIRAAKAIYNFDRFVVARYTRGQWSFEEIL